MISSFTPKLVQKVINEIGLTREDIEELTEIKGTYKKYYKHIIYDLSKKQFVYLNSVVIFPEEIRTVKQKQKELVNYLEINPQYKDRNFFYIFIKLAHQSFTQRNKIRIIGERRNQELLITHLFDNNEEHEEEHEEERRIPLLNNGMQQLTI